MNAGTKQLPMMLTTTLSGKMAKACKPFCQGQSATEVVASVMDFAISISQAFGLNEEEMMEAFRLCTQMRRRAGATFRGEGAA